MYGIQFINDTTIDKMDITTTEQVTTDIVSGLIELNMENDNYLDGDAQLDNDHMVIYFPGKGPQ